MKTTRRPVATNRLSASARCFARLILLNLGAPASLPEFMGNVVVVRTAPFWDDELEALQGRMDACWPKVDARVAAEKDTSWENKEAGYVPIATRQEWGGSPTPPRGR